MRVPVKEIALRTIELEARSIAGLSSYINEDFERAVEALKECGGRIVISGIGKSAVIAQKKIGRAHV